MWVLLLFDFLFSLLVVAGPGYFVFRLVGFGRAASISFAPLASFLAMTISVFVLRALGIWATWQTVLFSMAAAILLACAIAALLRNKLKLNYEIDYRLIIIACGVSTIVAFFYYVLPLDSAVSFYQENDNIAHLSAVREFLDTGIFCHESIASYPALWRSFAAVVASFGAGEVTVAANAVNLLLITYVYPSTMAAFIQVVLPNHERARLLASCFVSAFAAFPWGLLIFGPLYPNIAGNALLPLAMAAFAMGIRSERRNEALIWVFIFMAGCLLLFYAHPNALFTGVVVLTPLCVKTIWNRTFCAGFTAKRRKLLCGGFILFVVLTWTILYKMPALRGVVSFDWPSYTSVSQAIVNILTLALNKVSAPQIVLGILVLFGLYVSMNDGEHSWMVASYVLLCAIYVADVALGGRLQHYLAGFWYSDSFRVASSFVFVLVPLASLGLDGVFSTVSRLRLVISGDKVVKRTGARSAFAMGCLLFVVFCPSFSIPKNAFVTTGFGAVEGMMDSGNLLAENQNGLDKEEIRFLREVHEVVGDNPILNYPYDGSAYAYAVEDLNVVNRGWYENGNYEVALLGREADELSSNSEVQAAFHSLGVKYVLLLDYDRENGGLYMAGGYSQSSWTGLEKLNDETPGFKIVLKQGDMRLYEIE